jgi:hypothetical protein
VFALCCCACCCCNGAALISPIYWLDGLLRHCRCITAAAAAASGCCRMCLGCYCCRLVLHCAQPTANT